MKRIIHIGFDFELEVEDNAEYLDQNGAIDSFKVIYDHAKEHMGKPDEQIIKELKALKSMSNGEMAVHRERKEYLKIEAKRQVLTIAFAIKHETNWKDVGLLCINDAEYELFLYLCTAFNYHLSKDRVETELSLGQDLISSKYRKSMKGTLEELEKAISELDKSLLDKGLPFTSSTYFKALANCGILSTLDNYQNDINLRYSTVKRLKEEGKFPPYGVAHSIIYVDNGVDILPWNKDFTDTQKSELLKAMHEIADSSASTVYKVILAAFCCQCFEEVPSFPSVQNEFSSTKLNKGKYSSKVNYPLKKANIDWRPRNKRAAEDAIYDRRIDPDQEILSQINTIIAAWHSSTAKLQ